VGGIWAKGGGPASAKRAARKNHCLACNRIPPVPTGVSEATPRLGTPQRRIRDNLVRDFDHKVLVRFFGRGNAIEGDQRECSQYCGPELHASLPAIGSVARRSLQAKDLAAVKLRRCGSRARLVALIRRSSTKRRPEPAKGQETPAQDEPAGWSGPGFTRGSR